MADDDTISQFLAITGSSDPSIATQYLEMSNNNLEMAISLFMDTGGGAASAGGASAASGGGGGGFSGGGIEGDAAMAAALQNEQNAQNEVRAPDASRSMRLVGGPDSPGRGGGARLPQGMAGFPGGLPPGVGAFANGRDIPPALLAAMGGPAAREMMRNMAAGDNGMGGRMDDAMMGSMGGNWASSSSGGAGGGAGRQGSGNSSNNNRRSRSSASSGASSGAGNARRRNRSNNSDDDEVQVVDADGNAMDEDDEYAYEDSDDDSHDLGGTAAAASSGRGSTSTQTMDLSQMFAQPTHLMHRAGGFMGAKNFAKDARRWLLVNIQSEDDFACHALNRDVWRNDMVESIVREGFILFQAMSNSSEGQTYIQRYKVQGYPHLAIIDPRTGSLLWRKEGWTQVNPLTAEQFIEISTDFSSNHSFDTMPMAARNAYSSAIPMGASNDSDSKKRPIHELTEEEQLQAAIRASMAESAEGGDDDEVEVIDGSAEDDKKPSAVNDSTKAKEEEVEAEEEPGPSAFEQEILTMEVGDEPTAGDVARVQIKMPDGKRLVRKFAGDSPVKLIYAFVAQSNDDAKGGKAFELKAKFPPVDLFANIDDGIKSCGLNGEAIHVIWK